MSIAPLVITKGFLLGSFTSQVVALILSQVEPFFAFVIGTLLHSSGVGAIVLCGVIPITLGSGSATRVSGSIASGMGHRSNVDSSRLLGSALLFRLSICSVGFY